MGFKKKATKKNKDNKESRKPIIRDHAGYRHKGQATHMMLPYRYGAPTETLDRNQMVLTKVADKELHQNEIFEIRYKQNPGCELSSD